MNIIELNHQDINFVLRRLPRKLRELMKNPAWAGKIFVGGGCIRSVIANEEVNDIDLFVPDKNLAAKLARDLVMAQFARTMPVDTKQLESWFGSHIYLTANAITLRHFEPTIQIIHRWTFDKPEDVVKSFDFSVCCAAIGYRDSQWQGVACERFYVDLAARRLVYMFPKREEEPGGSMLRVLKYYQKGYRMPLDSLAGVIARISMGVNWDKIGTEEQAATILTGLLRAVDPLVDLTHEAHLPAENSADGLPPE